MTYEEYRKNIVSKASSYLDIIRKESDKFKIDLLDKKIQRAQCLPDGFYIFKVPKEYANDSNINFLNNLLISIDTTMLPAISYLYTINSDATGYQINSVYFIWRRDNNNANITPLFIHNNPAPIVPYYYVEEQNKMIVTYADWGWTSLKEIKDIYPDPELLSATLTIGWLTILYPEQKDMLLNGFVQYGIVLDEQTRVRIAQQLDINGEFNEQQFVRWFTQQNTNIIRLVRYLIDTKSLLDKHRDLIFESEEEEIDLEESGEEQLETEQLLEQPLDQQVPKQLTEQPLQQVNQQTQEQTVKQQSIEQPTYQQEQVLEQSPARQPVVSQLIVPSTNSLEWLKNNYKNNQQWILPLALPIVFPYINYFDGIVTTQISLVLRFYGIKLRNLLYSNHLFAPNDPVLIDAPIDQQELAVLSKTNYIILNTPYDNLNLYQLPILTPEQIQNIPEGIYQELTHALSNMSIDYDTLVNESLQLPVHKRDGYIMHKVISMLIDH